MVGQTPCRTAGDAAVSAGSNLSAVDNSAVDIEADDSALDSVHWRPRVAVTRTEPMDLAAAERASTELLVALGLPVDSPAMRETPRRMVQAYAELLSGPAFDFTTFPNTEKYDELVLVRHLPVRSLCEHHMLPFTGVAHVGYLPDDRVLGLSKFARLVEFFARRAQTQERMTRQIADHLWASLAPRGVGVVVEAEHTCMTLRGVRAVGSTTVTSTLLGSIRDDASTRAEFLSLTRPDTVRRSA
jgi:GTP cyclohydrolase IA